MVIINTHTFKSSLKLYVYFLSYSLWFYLQFVMSYTSFLFKKIEYSQISSYNATGLHRLERLTIVLLNVDG